ncbi:MAG TPA: ferritin-like domain-containing protein [Candidatus Binatia bacterium]|nr:ferritin-like domain-containing protein [Candidatus Binatia bacterium]
MQIDSLEKLFVDQLKDVYNAEKQIVRALPRMSKAAGNEELKEAFDTHLRETEKHVDRLEQIFKDLGKNPTGKKCMGMEGLIEEAKELLNEDVDEEVLDAGLIAAAQRVEHYEMAAYGCLKTYAGLLGNERAARLLEETLGEEKRTDDLLTQIAERSINVEAMEAETGSGTSARGGSSKRGSNR